MKKVILISGASNGMGKAMAEKLSDKHQVVILARQAEKTEKVAKELGVDYVVVEVADYSQIQAAVKQVLDKYGQIHCLINCAGVWFPGLLEDIAPEKIKQMLEVNSLGTIWLTQAVLPSMKQARQGRIINIISQAGLYVKAQRSAYNASKWAVTGFTKSLQQELKGSGVSVSGIYPGKVKTHIFKKAGVDMDVSDAVEVADVVRAVEFVVETPAEVSIPELGVESTL